MLGVDNMKKYLLLSLFALILASCGNNSESSNQITNTLIVTPTPQPTLRIVTSTSADEVSQYTQELYNRIRDCINFRDAFDFSYAGEFVNHKLGTNKVKECINFVLELETPAECDGCEELSPMIESFSNKTLESLDLIVEGFEQQKPAFISEGLITFWDADLIWDAIRLTLDSIRAEHNLPELN